MRVSPLQDDQTKCETKLSGDRQNDPHSKCYAQIPLCVASVSLSLSNNRRRYDALSLSLTLSFSCSLSPALSSLTSLCSPSSLSLTPSFLSLSLALPPSLSVKFDAVRGQVQISQFNPAELCDCWRQTYIVHLCDFRCVCIPAS